jgi:hypothetical protein
MRRIVAMIGLLTMSLISQAAKAQDWQNIGWVIKSERSDHFRLLLGVSGTDLTFDVSFVCRLDHKTIKFDVEMTEARLPFLLDLMRPDNYPDGYINSGPQSERVFLSKLSYSEFLGLWKMETEGVRADSPIWAEAVQSASLVLTRKDYRLELMPPKEFGLEALASFAADCASGTVSETPEQNP